MAQLCRRFGVERLTLIEDAVQSTLFRAHRHWARHSPPERPQAWLYRAAYREVLDGLRKQRAQENHETRSEPPAIEETGADSLAAFSSEVSDPDLAMLFACASDRLPEASQLVIALRVILGFGLEEIASALFTTRANAQKRLDRARAELQTSGADLCLPFPELQERLPRVLKMIYLLHNEGYSSRSPERVIRKELCVEAARLVTSLLRIDGLATPEAYALYALVLLHTARFDARLDGQGGLLLLEEQDRSLFQRDLILEGMRALQASASGEIFSKYHALAAISLEHCIAPSYAETRWSEIISIYDMLDRIEPSPISKMNRAIAIAERDGPAEGLAVLQSERPPSWLGGYYLWQATHGELLRRMGHFAEAERHLAAAREAAPTEAEKALLGRRLKLAADGDRSRASR